MNDNLLESISIAAEKNGAKLLTPLLNGNRVSMFISREDMVSINRMGKKDVVLIEDVLLGGRFTAKLSACGNGCFCDVSIKRVKQ